MQQLVDHIAQLGLHALGLEVPQDETAFGEYGEKVKHSSSFFIRSRTVWRGERKWIFFLSLFIAVGLINIDLVTSSLSVPGHESDLWWLILGFFFVDFVIQKLLGPEVDITVCFCLTVLYIDARKTVCQQLDHRVSGMSH